MIERITQSRWLKYIIETLTLTFILGLCFGIVLGLVRSWEYNPKKMLNLIFYTLNFSINQSLLIVFLFSFLYLLVFFALYHVVINTKWTCFVSSAILLLPVFLFLSYRINKTYIAGFFELRAIIWNLIMGIGFILLWLLVSIGLFFWTKSRILKATTINIRGLSLLVCIVLVFNISMFLFYRLHRIDTANVIILIIDALRADHVSSYGYSRNTTPHVDKFAKDSVMFTQAISQSTFTKTSIASLFTSLYPYQHGIYWGGLSDPKGNITSAVLGEDETTLAETLLQNGFLTMAWMRQHQLLSSMGFIQGFVGYDNDRRNNIEGINEKFFEWIDRMGTRHKFFAYIHYTDLLGVNRPKPPYDTMYGVYNDVYSAIQDWGSFYINEIRNKVRENKRKLEKKDVDQLKAYYDGQLTYIDSEIGLLLEELKKLGLYDNSLIIVTADHGDAFMEHGFVQHDYTPYDELLRVPLIIKFPKSLYAGRVVKSQVRLIDVMPTILDFLKIGVHNKLEGFSLLNYLDDNKNKDDKIDFPKYAISEWGTTLSIRTEKFKYIHCQNKEDELYDLSLDSREKNNIINLKPEEAEKFRRMALEVVLERKKKEVGKVILDKETIEELKALGYIE